STHFSQRTAADGDPGPVTIPVRIRFAINNPTQVRVASGANSVNIPAVNIHPP
ncbi:unnamed protein product, partial [Rotaria magnacalcarata]